MEKTTDVGERIGSVEDPIVVKSMEKNVLVSDIPAMTKEIKDDGDVLVMVGAEIAESQNDLGKEPKKGSGLLSIPTILEKELHELLTENGCGEKKKGLEGTVKKDGNWDDRAVIAERVEEGVDKKEKTKKKDGSDGEKKENTEKKVGSEGDKKKKEKKEDDPDKEKKEKKDKENRESKKDKEKAKSDKEDKEKEKKEKKEKKSKKSNVERIQKKLEKIHAKIERILAKKEEYVQRLAEAQEKDRQEKERLSAEKAANQERDLPTAIKSSSEIHGDTLLEGEVREGQEAEAKQVPPLQSGAKQPDEETRTPISASNIDTTEKEVRFPEEKVITDQFEKVEDVKHTSGQDAHSNDGESGALSFSA